MEHPLANIVTAEGGRLRFASCDTGLRTVGAPVGEAQFRSDWFLDFEFQAITFSTYGGFGSSAHALINKMTAEAHPYDFDPWARPGPKSHAYLQLGFALARANARMLINADASRRSAHNRVRTSRLRSPT